MKNNKYIRTGLCLFSLAAMQLNAVDVATTSDVTLQITSLSQLTTGPITFATTNVALTGAQSYWSGAQNWTFNSTDTNGYSVTVSTDAGVGVTSWNLASGGNNIAFVLVTNKQIDGTATGSAITGTPGVNGTAVSSLGGRILSPNTTPTPDSNILYDKGAVDTTNYTYQMFGAIDQAAMALPLEGAYTKTLTIDLVEK